MNQEENNRTEDTGEYEKVCMLCRRTEKKAGKLITIAGQMCICSDCMQKTMDAMGSMGFPFTDLSGVNLSNLTSGIGDASGSEKTADMTTETGEASSTDPGKASLTGQEQGSEKLTGDSGEKLTGDDPKKPEEEPPAGENRSKSRIQGFPGISMINLTDLFGQIPQRQRIKKKKPKEEQEARVFDPKKVPLPHKIKASLDEYVVGQEHAKKVISVAVYNHYKRIGSDTLDEIEIEKSNMLMLGPTGSGKTYLVKTLARLLDVPLAIADATSLTEAGYIGDDIESVLSRLLAAADNDVERAEQGIVYIDEIDKIARKKNASQRDVSGESVQQGMLRLLEGSDVEVPVGATNKNAMVPMETINTRNILFICGGAFPGLEDIIRERLNRQSLIGFGSALKDQYDNDANILSKATVEDLRHFGMIPEFLGRLPVIYALEGLSEDTLVRILEEPKNAIIAQYQKLLAMDEVHLEFDREALAAIAHRALEKKTGARALRAILEDIMLDIMYEIPKDDNIGTVRITREYVEGTGCPVISLRNAGYLEG